MSVSSSFDSKGFRAAMGRFATGVAVATVRDPVVGPVGVTINSLTSVSLDPALILFCIDKTAHCMTFFMQNINFGINVLAESQQALSTHFARHHDRPWEGILWHDSPHGVPLLDGAIARLDCQRVATYEGGDHLIFLGQVIGIATEDAPPLLYFKGKYGRLGDE
jgi:flavin reductase (DIM6/NTAB) family NADH-FMN oxidoreductase RutF